MSHSRDVGNRVVDKERQKRCRNPLFELDTLAAQALFPRLALQSEWSESFH
jgi:hypothetical protein